MYTQAFVAGTKTADSGRDLYLKLHQKRHEVHCNLAYRLMKGNHSCDDFSFTLPINC